MMIIKCFLLVIKRSPFILHPFIDILTSFKIYSTYVGITDIIAEKKLLFLIGTIIFNEIRKNLLHSHLSYIK